MNKNFGVAISILLGLLVTYQNCGKMQFAKINPLETVDRVPGGNCVPGTKLSIFFDDDNQTYIGDIIAYTGNLSSTENYGYYSSSAHPVHGPNPIGYEVHNFFYQGSDGLMLNFYGNVDSDDGSAGSADNEYSLQIITKQNNGADKVIFVDDPMAVDNVDYVNLQKFSTYNKYDAYLHYWYNTDGAVIGPFNGQDYEIHVKILSSGDLKGARFYSSDGGSFNLGLSGLMSYVIKYRGYETCTN
jgi:hypothetical protein